MTDDTVDAQPKQAKTIHIQMVHTSVRPDFQIIGKHEV